MKGFVVLLACIAVACAAFQRAPPGEKPVAPVGPNSTKVTGAGAQGSLVVNTLQATAEFSLDSHNGQGWRTVAIAPALNNFCSQTSSIFYGQNNVQTGCEVYYDPSTSSYYLKAFSGAIGSSSWCKARCLTWS